MNFFEKFKVDAKQRQKEFSQLSAIDSDNMGIPSALRRDKPLNWPEVLEMDAVRHYTCLSKLNFCIDTNFYPLGSCTMKYNPKICHQLAELDGFSQLHPSMPDKSRQGLLEILYNLQQDLAEISGMEAVALGSMAGAQGEFAGVRMIKQYHEDRGDSERIEMLVPDAAHGTNPASAIMAGFKVREIPTKSNGDIDLSVLEKAVGPQTAGIMLTNPSTCGVFEQNIKAIAACVHKAGGLLYYDGANLNAILGRVRPGDMGFDVMHMNLHKTFATPHGGGGPGAGPVAANSRLAKYLPLPRVCRTAKAYRLMTKKDCPHSMGYLSTYLGNVGVLLRAYIYIKMLGSDGLRRVSAYAALNANYLMKRLQDSGFKLAFPGRKASHEFIISFAGEKQEYNVTAMDIAKQLLDEGFHAPTTYFPLLVPECFLIEPTETESKATLDAFVEALVRIANKYREDATYVKEAPYNQPVRRLDDVKAAKELDLSFFK